MHSADMVSHALIVDALLQSLTCDHELHALDIGTNTGFVCLRSLMKGVDQCTGIDLDTQVIDKSLEVREMLHLDTTWRIHNMKLSTLQSKSATFNVVYAFAVVHWLFSCTETSFSLDKVVSGLRAMTEDVLVIEWVMPNDPVITGWHHTTCPAGTKGCEYTTEEFEASLKRNFSHYKKLKATRSTRPVYAAYVDPTRCYS